MILKDGHTYEAYRDMIDATSSHRPDTSWAFVDAQGHEHRWYANGEPAKGYSPTTKYETPTLHQVGDGEFWFDDDGKCHEFMHLECVQCDEVVKPAYKADDTTQYVPGLLHCKIDGRSVTPDEFKAAVEAAMKEES